MRTLVDEGAEVLISRRPCKLQQVLGTMTHMLRNSVDFASSSSVRTDLKGGKGILRLLETEKCLFLESILHQLRE